MLALLGVVTSPPVSSPVVTSPSTFPEDQGMSSAPPNPRSRRLIHHVFRTCSWSHLLSLVPCWLHPAVAPARPLPLPGFWGSLIVAVESVMLPPRPCPTPWSPGRQALPSPTCARTPQLAPRMPCCWPQPLRYSRRLGQAFRPQSVFPSPPSITPSWPLLRQKALQGRRASPLPFGLAWTSS